MTAPLTRLLLRPADWTEQAACTQPAMNPDWWHSDHPKAQTRARTICAGCPVRIDCAADALTHADPWGVWGGLNKTDRTHAAQQWGYDPPGAARCGTRSRYVAGCRCPDCRRAHATYEHSRRLRARTPGYQPRHRQPHPTAPPKRGEWRRRWHPAQLLADL